MKLTWLTRCSNPFQSNPTAITTTPQLLQCPAAIKANAEWWIEIPTHSISCYITLCFFLLHITVCVSCALCKTEIGSPKNVSPARSSNTFFWHTCLECTAIASVTVGWLNSYCCSNWSAFGPMIYVHTHTETLAHTRREPVFRLRRDHVYFPLDGKPKVSSPGRMLFYHERPGAGAHHKNWNAPHGIKHLITCGKVHSQLKGTHQILAKPTPPLLEKLAY